MEPTIKTDKYELYLGDCLSVLPHLSGVDAVVTDPPYGIELDKTGCNSIHKGRGIFGDNYEFDPRAFLSFPTVILFGANNFTEHLPRGGWLCWDKRLSENADRMVGSPFELAWINDCKKFRMFRIQHGGVVNADKANQKRVHPTQKPVALMSAVVQLFSQMNEVILDPFMGSGTTGVACMNLGRKFIGIEKEPKYFEIAAKRIEAAAAQGQLFDQQPSNKALHTDCLNSAAEFKC